ncbi:testis-expressed protein 264 homolog isoform X2 [Cherax quadricarinatus]|uniref:testis-expressed protein 264 homolog isoform X2 n=1 Tax=Cherax quadricarinatus TaxID=27406 RepID=UPI0023798431|nr:testis-expressed protein 264 homolog isoform X2 [Cherax quadricarinatus]
MDTETALLWGFLILILLVVATIIGLLVHSGLFIPVDVKTCKPNIGEVYIAYKFARGPYKESGTLFTQVHTLLPEYRTIGVYYDDPKMRQSHKLRYIVGVILSENGSPVTPEHRKLLEENGYEFATFPAIDHAVQTTFPFNSTISIIVAVMKVYPALREYVELRSLCAHPFLEVYDNQRSEIIFIGPLARQDDFYVPEVQQEEEEEEDRQDEYDDRTENSSRSWDESASFVRGEPAEIPSTVVTGVDTADAAEAPDVADTGSIGGEESDANTGSSFEEIDEKEAAAFPVTNTTSNRQDGNLKKDEDEGER